MIFEFAAELRHEAFNRHRKAVREHADGVAFHVARHVDQHLQIFHLAATVFEVGQQLLDPYRLFYQQ